MACRCSLDGTALDDAVERTSKKAGREFVTLDAVCSFGSDRCKVVDFVAAGEPGRRMARVKKGERVVGVGRLEYYEYKDKKGEQKERWQLRCSDIVAISTHFPPAASRRGSDRQQFSGDQIAAMEGDPFALDE